MMKKIPTINRAIPAILRILSAVTLFAANPAKAPLSGPISNIRSDEPSQNDTMNNNTWAVLARVNVYVRAAISGIHGRRPVRMPR